MRESLDRKWKEIQARMGEMLPAHMHDAVERWIWDGIFPGSFLTSVLINDLKGAALGADSHNSAALANWAKFFVWYMPQASWGSQEKATNWSSEGGWNGMLRSEECQQ